ncbi:MAG: sigma-70 family RNA polymerase sigma factor [Candidatus Binatus sp.]
MKARAVSKVGADADSGEMAERTLVEAAQRDRNRFADLYEANFERVYAFVARRVRDRDEAQDLTADVFHLALKNLPRFEWRGVPFAAWLFRIASNEIADRSKSIAKRRTHEREGVFQERDDDAGVTASFEEAERRARLFKLVEGLPRDQSRVIAMRFAEDKSIREIAAALGRTEGSIKQLQFRAMQNLRVRLGDTNG